MATSLQGSHDCKLSVHEPEVIREISLLDWESDSSIQVLIREFQLANGKCNVRVSDVDTGNFIVITGIHQPGFGPMYGSPNKNMTTIYFCCYNVEGDVLPTGNPIRSLMRGFAHDALDTIYKK